MSPAQPNERHTRPPHRRAIVAAALLVFATIGIAAAAAASAEPGWTVYTEVEVEGSTGTWPAPKAKTNGKVAKVAPKSDDAAPADEPPGTGEQPTDEPTTEDPPPPGDGSDGGDTGPPPAGEPEVPPTETQ